MRFFSKLARLLLAAAPIFLLNFASFALAGEPEIPAKFMQKD